MPLPVSRNRTYSVGSPVVAADLNDLMDQVIALNAIKTYQLLVGAGVAYGVGLAVGSGGSVDMDATADRAYWNAPVPTGKKLVSARATLTDNATGTTQVQLELFTKVGASLVSTGAGVTSNGNGSAKTIAVTPVSPLTIAAGTAYILRGTVSAANLCSVHFIEWNWTD